MEVLYYLIPLGVIGAWRWSVWILKRGIATFYRPVKNNFKMSVSLVTPVYNENPKVFQSALDSWKVNNPDEIIAVIDYTDKKCIKVFKKFAKSNITATVHYKPLHKFSAYTKLVKNVNNLRNTEEVYDEIISLPFYPQISKIAQDKVIKCIKQ